MVDHPEFSGRARKLKDFREDDMGDYGTEVDGIIGSVKYGISKSCNLLSVKILDKYGKGDTSDLIAALEFVIKHHQKSGKLGVVNISIANSFSSFINHAVKMAKKAGLVIVVPAGNKYQDACRQSSASLYHAITVGVISHVDDGITSLSNWGYPRIAGETLMAAPVVTGLVANLLNEGILPEKFKEVLLERSTKDKMPIRAPTTDDTPNIIAYSGILMFSLRNQDYSSNL